MKHIISIFTFILLLLLFTNNTHATLPSIPYVPDEVIVKYKESQSPDDLKSIVEKRQKGKQTIFGFFQITISDIQTRLQKKQTPEDKLQQLQKTGQKAGVVSQKSLFENNEGIKNTYLLKLKGKNKVQDAIGLYKKLDSVEYAEPNYILHIQ